MQANEILKIYGTSFKENTKQLLEEADLASRIASKESRIAIKPNLVSADPAENGATTHPEIIAGIIEYLKEHGFSNLEMVEGSWVGDLTTEAFAVCGYLSLSEKYGVPLVDAQEEPASVMDCCGMDIRVIDRVKDYDFLINVPVLKGHCQTKITCAIKNIKGLIPNTEKRRFHSLGLHTPLAHLVAGVHQDFIVVDHICGDLDFEDGGNPFIQNCIMAAVDPVLVDSHVCQLLGYDITEVPYLPMAESLGAGSTDIRHAAIRILGDDHSRPLPRKRKVVEVQDLVEEVESCSACYGYLIPALNRLQEEGISFPEDTRIAIGQGYRGKSGKLGVGHCTCGFEFCVDGCPPTENQIYDALRSYIDGHSDSHQ